MCEENAMYNYWLSVVLLFAAILTLACGSSPSSRQLRSITIHTVVNGSELQFTATGTYSAPPTTVTPLPVNWSFGLMAPPPNTLQYTLTTQPFIFNCLSAGPFAGVTAVAPSDPNAPATGTLPFAKMTVASASTTCP
jgi:hypothetical protein